MKRAGVAAFVGEMKSLGLDPSRGDLSQLGVGPIVVSGVLAEQLAKELGAGAAAGAVVVGDDRRVGTGRGPCPHHRRRPDFRGRRSSCARRRRRASRSSSSSSGRRRTGRLRSSSRRSSSSAVPDEGFPIRAIADRIAEATEDSAALASAVPAIADAARAGAHQAGRDSLGAHRRGGEPVRRLAAAHLARAGAYGIAGCGASRLRRSWATTARFSRQGRRPSWRPDSPFEESRGRRGGSCPIRSRTPPSPQRVRGCWRRRSRRSSRTFHPTSRTPNGVRPDQVLGCARTDHGNDDAEHGAGRGAVAARGSRRVVRVPRVHPRSDRRRDTPSSSRGRGRACHSACVRCARGARGFVLPLPDRGPSGRRWARLVACRQVMSTEVLNPRSARPGMPVAAPGPARDRNEENEPLALRWFRFGKKQDEPAAEEPAVAEVEAPPEARQAAVTEPGGRARRPARRRGVAAEVAADAGRRSRRRLPLMRTATSRR